MAMSATTRMEQEAMPVHSTQQRAAWARWLVPLLLASVVLRVVIVATSEVQTTPDSPGYAALADRFLHHRLADDPGERTPLYPLFLALCGLHLPFVRLAQMALGVGITAALFRLAWRAGASPRIAALAAACYGLSITAVVHEDAILTETLATALLVAFACLIQGLAERAGAPQRCRRTVADAGWSAHASGIRAIALAIGIIAGLVALTRPLYAFLPLVLAVPFAVARRSGLSRPIIAQGICCMMIPALVLIGGWSVFNAARFGTFGPTVLTGYNLSNHSGGFIEYAPERDAPLRDIYLKYRTETIAETGSYVTTIWAARPEMLARTGLTNAQLSQALTALSVRLFVHHPVRYARSVAESWLRFWNAPGETLWRGANDATTGRIIGAIWIVQRGGFVMLNILFLALTVGAVCVPRLRRRWSPSVLPVTLCALIWGASITQALLEKGSNTRFGVPTEPLIAYVVIVAAVSWRPLCDHPAETCAMTQPTPAQEARSVR